MAARDTGVYVATETFVCEVDGVQEVIHGGRTRVRGGHVLLAAYPQYFQRSDQGVQFEVEQATAAPGEKRGQQAVR